MVTWWSTAWIKPSCLMSWTALHLGEIAGRPGHLQLWVTLCLLIAHSLSCHIWSHNNLLSCWGCSPQSVQLIENFVSGPGGGTGDIILIFGKGWRMEVAKSVSDCPLVDLYSWYSNCLHYFLSDMMAYGF